MTDHPQNNRTALVLPGGGARGAFQVGVLRDHAREERELERARLLQLARLALVLGLLLLGAPDGGHFGLMILALLFLTAAGPGRNLGLGLFSPENPGA